MAKQDEMIAGIDLGGTSLRALIVDAKNEILAEEKTPSHPSRGAEKVIADIALLVGQALDKAGLKHQSLGAVSIGAPGQVDLATGLVHVAPNLGWKEVPLGQKLGKLLGVPVVVDNDVHVGTVGEHALGAGRGTRNMVGIFVGTGIGGGIIIDGQLFTGSHGAGGEVGHTVLLADGPTCSCGQPGHAEALSSRTAMERDIRAAIKAGAKSVVPDIMKRKNKDRMTSSVLHAALKEKDRVVREVIAKAEFYLGLLVANIVNIFDPECVVIGGGIAERLGEDFVAPIRKTAAENYLNPLDAERIKVVPGDLGDNAGALGAVVLARQRLGKS